MDSVQNGFENIPLRENSNNYTPSFVIDDGNPESSKLRSESQSPKLTTPFLKSTTTSSEDWEEISETDLVSNPDSEHSSSSVCDLNLDPKQREIHGGEASRNRNRDRNRSKNDFNFPAPSSKSSRRESASRNVSRPEKRDPVHMLSILDSVLKSTSINVENLMILGKRGINAAFDSSKSDILRGDKASNIRTKYKSTGNIDGKTTRAHSALESSSSSKHLTNIRSRSSRHNIDIDSHNDFNVSVGAGVGFGTDSEYLAVPRMTQLKSTKPKRNHDKKIKVVEIENNYELPFEKKSVEALLIPSNDSKDSSTPVTRMGHIFDPPSHPPHINYDFVNNDSESNTLTLTNLTKTGSADSSSRKITSKSISETFSELPENYVAAGHHRNINGHGCGYGNKRYASRVGFHSLDEIVLNQHICAPLQRVHKPSCKKIIDRSNYTKFSELHFPSLRHSAIVFEASPLTGGGSEAKAGADNASNIDNNLVFASRSGSTKSAPLPPPPQLSNYPAHQSSKEGHILGNKVKYSFEPTPVLEFNPPTKNSIKQEIISSLRRQESYYFDQLIQLCIFGRTNLIWNNFSSFSPPSSSSPFMPSTPISVSISASTPISASISSSASIPIPVSVSATTAFGF